MKNRFFDINENKYLNSLYMIAFFQEKSQFKIKRLLIYLYLFKFPIVLYKLFESPDIKLLFQDFEINNLSKKVVSIDSTIHTNSFYESLSFLFSKDLVRYDDDNDFVYITETFLNIESNKIPLNIKRKVKKILALLEKETIENIENKIILTGVT